MKIVDVFAAVRDGTFEDFINHYDGDVNKIHNGLDINLLCMAMVNDENSEDKLKIIKFLMREKIDVNYVTRSKERNTLHVFFFCNFRPGIDFQLEITRLLIDSGVNLNYQDKYLAIPLKYALTINKNLTKDNENMYRILIEKGSDYNLDDKFGKSCLDYAKEYAWRKDFITIVQDYENERK